MKRALIPLLVFVALAVVLAIGLGRDPHAVPSPLVGRPAPEFVAPRLHEPEATLSRADLLGQVAVMNVFASWCLECRLEHPYVTELAERYDVPVYGLNYKDSREKARDWLARYGDAYTAIAYDPAGRIGLDWGVYGVPETFVLDRHGIIRHKRVGVLNAEVLRDEILPLIEKLRAER